MYQYSLFNLSEHESFSQKIQSLHPTDLNGLFGSAVLARGQGYYHNKQIENVRFQPGKVTAKAFGQDLYDVMVEREDQGITGHCSCPYDGPCKHLAALLLYVINDPEPEALEILDSADPTGEEGQSFEAYIDALTKEELKQLVLQFAPDSFRHTIRLKFAGRKTQQREFLYVKNGVQNLFTRDLYDIEAFETELSDWMEQIRGLWLEMPDEIGELLLYVIEQVGESFEEGYLYGHYSDHSYDGLAFGCYMAEFIAAMPPQKRTVWLPKLWESINGLAYTTFDNFPAETADRIPPEELVHFKELVLENDLTWGLAEYYRRHIYNKIEPVLDDGEKQSLLEELSSSSNYFTIRLAEYDESKGEIARAIELLDKKLNEEEANRPFYYSARDELFEKRIQMEEEYRDGKSTFELTKKYLENVPRVQSIQFAKRVLPEKLQRFEAILEKQNPSQFVEYLEEEERLTEIPPLFKKYPRQLHLSLIQYPFYQRHRQLFPKLALRVFEKVLEDELPHTGDRHYYKVAEVLNEIKAIKPEEEFEQQVAEIKSTYSRRRKLKEILSQAGL